MKHAILLTAFSAAMLLATPAAFAVGEPKAETAEAAKTSIDCPSGEIWVDACVVAEAGKYSDDQIATAARDLAYGGRNADSIHVLQMAADQNDPRILNYMGFNNRKMGRFEVGIGYYREALAKDPDYILARSYMGEGMMLAGDKAGAMEQLREIEARGGKDSEAYQMLAKAIETGKPNY
jgi:tetratricopeptide (TPR) repeat protein